MTKLWLDDLRTPPDDSWRWCRSAEEAYLRIRVHGIPNVISLDHDLGENQPSGLDVAKYIIFQDMLRVHKMPDDFQFHVHSANPCGRDNIQSLLDSYLRHREKRNAEN